MGGSRDEWSPIRVWRLWTLTACGAAVRVVCGLPWADARGNTLAVFDRPMAGRRGISDARRRVRAIHVLVIHHYEETNADRRVRPASLVGVRR